jgi:hypothetical protein
MSVVELRGFPIPVRYFLEEFETVYRITIDFRTQCRDGKGAIQLFQYYSYSKDYYTEVEAIRTALIDSMTHEIDECLYLDGDRVFDPHIPEKLHP